MKNIAISGSWRNSTPELENDVEKIVKSELGNGNCIITWWAPWVDYLATEIVLKHWNPRKNLKIFLPVKLELLLKHFEKRILEWILDKNIWEKVIFQLKSVKEKFPNSIFDETIYADCNEESYFARNTTIIENCDKLYAFCVNGSKWTMDAYLKALSLWKEAILKEYEI